MSGVLIIQLLHGPHGHGTASVRHGQTRQGQQRDRGRAKRWVGRPGLLASPSPGPAPEGKRQSVAMALNARGMRATARGLPVSPHTGSKA